VQWHPVRPILVTASDQGLLHIWVTNVIERFSAYAAGFEELEENLEYQEREDEFDVEDEMEAERRKLSIQDVLVDVIGAEGLPTVSSELLHAGQPGYMELQAYLASSDAWADAEPDEDDQDDFAPPLDIDIHDYELEYEAQNAIVINA
jgi:COMPASS component SWD1